MKKIIVFLTLVFAVVLLAVAMKETSIHKLVIVNWPSRIGELIAWVDKKSLDGGLKNQNNELGSYVFVGDYDIDIDFDRTRYGLGKGAAARVVVDENHDPLSVVFIDGSRCGIAIALHAENNPQDAFGNMPSELRLSSSRVGTFCVKRD